MQQKFNESLVQQVREGKLAIENTDKDKITDLIAHIFPADIRTLGRTNYYWASSSKTWTGDESTSIPSRPVSDFFLPAQLRIEDVTDKQVIHCETKEQMSELFRVLDRAGLKWNTGKSYCDTSDLWYREGFCVNPTRGTHATLCFYSENGYEILPASLFLQPPTEKEGKERTWTISRERLAQLAEENKGAFNRSSFVAFANKFIPVLESEKSFTEIELKNVAACHNEDFFSILFPDYSPTPHIPKGEFAWCLTHGGDWSCCLSEGDGDFNKGQKETLEKWTPKEVRKYEDRPF